MPQTQIIISAKDLATSTFRKVSTSVKGLAGNVFSLQTAFASAFTSGMALYVRESIKATDSIGKTADKIGLTTDQLQELRFAADLSGVAQNKLDMGMQRFSRRLGEVAQGTGELKKTAEQYGVQLYDNEGQMRSNMELLEDWSEVIRSAESDQEALRIAFKLFDSEGAALVNMLRDGSDGLNRARREAHSLGLVIDEDLIRKSADANDAITKMSSVMDTRFKATLVELAPEIISAADSMFDWVKANREFITQEVPEKVRDIVDRVKKFNECVSVAADSGLLQTAGLGYIGFRLFGAGPAKIITALYIINEGMKKLDKYMGTNSSVESLFDNSSELGAIFQEMRERWAADSRGEVDFWTGKPNPHMYRGQVTTTEPIAPIRRDSAQARREFLLADRASFVGDWMPKSGGTTLAEAETEKQRVLREKLNMDIKKMTMDQFAYARFEAEQTYQNDLAIAGKKRDLIVQAGERRRLSLKSIAEEEKRLHEDQADQVRQQREALETEIARATMESYDFQRFEAERYYADLKKRAEESGKDTVTIEAAKMRRISQINDAESEERKRDFDQLKQEIADSHIKILESSDNMVDGLELGLHRWRDAGKSAAESVADVMQDSMNKTSDIITDMLMGAEVSFDNFFLSIQRMAMQSMVSDPLTGMLYDGLGSMGSNFFSDFSFPKFERGGISHGPQLAWVSEGAYKHEAHVPLPDGRSIPVTMKNAPATTAVNLTVPVTVENKSTSARVQARQTTGPGGLPEVKVTVLDIVHNEFNRGGFDAHIVNASRRMG